MLEFLYEHAKFGGTQTSHTVGRAEDVELFVCLFLILLTSKVCDDDCAQRVL